MSSAKTLLHQILANPADDQARLVYADLLQAHGDPRGELITVDIELARAPRPELARRKRELLAEHGKRWWPDIAVEMLDVRRGFVERVAGTKTELHAASRMFETEPIHAAELCQLGRFEEAPWQANIRELVVRGTSGKEGLVTLGASLLGDRLESLDVSATMLQHVPDLQSAFSRLRVLRIADNDMLRHQPNHLVRWKRLAQLETFDVRKCRLDANALIAFVSKLSAVRELLLSGNPIGADGVAPLAKRLAGLRSLARLDVQETGIGPGGVKALAAALPNVEIVSELPRIVTLDLVGRELRLVHHAGSLWKLMLDGEVRNVEITSSVQFDGGDPPRVTHVGSGRKVKLEDLARSIAAGTARELEGKDVRLQIGSLQGAVYNTSVWESQTALFVLTGKTIELRYEEYIDASS